MTHQSDLPAAAGASVSDAAKPVSSSEVRALSRAKTPEQKERLFGKAARRLLGVPWDIQIRQICSFFCADPAYGLGVARALGMDLEALTRCVPAGSSARISISTPVGS